MQHIDKGASVADRQDGRHTLPLWKAPILDVLSIEDTELTGGSGGDGSARS